ncbi:MAG: M13-type metalloendopeptidase [Corynebacterium sp.]|nr:M13-type metalloendopeptidase [Corynebacterium sp.]
MEKYYIHDLYHEVNGSWLESFTIPDDRAVDGTFYDLRDQAEADVRALVKENPTSRAGSLFASFMDTTGIAEAGMNALEPDLEILQSNSITEFVEALGHLDRAGIGGFVNFYVAKDAGTEVEEPDLAVAYILQSGLGLPDEAYYREDQHQPILAQYEQHIARMLEFFDPALLPVSPQDAAQRIVALEKEIAAGHWDVVASRDAVRTYNPTQRDELPSPITEYLAAVGLPAGRVISCMPSYFEHVSALLDDAHLDDWKLWITWHILQARASILPEEVGAANFEFYGTALSGTPQQRERWKRALGLASSFVGEEIGQLFVAAHFPASSKQDMLELVSYLTAAYEERISKLEWMSAETKQRALEKLGKFQAKIGYPDTWISYGDLAFASTGAQLADNVRRGSEFTLNYHLNKLGKPYPRAEWVSTPQTVNAFYNPTVNDITFPAAILRPPFYDPDADAAENFGAIGAVIGHEIGHGFDDQGSQYDGDGNLESWWTDADREAFQQLTAKLVTQFDGRVPSVLSGVESAAGGVNGKFTLGENIGDLGGLGIAIIAYGKYLADKGRSWEETQPWTHGGGAAGLESQEFTGLQRLFFAWARVWRTAIRPEMAAQYLAVDPHSPAEFRCNIIAANIPEFYEAFEVDSSSPFWVDPADRVQIW